MSEFGGYNEKYAIGRAMERYGGSFMRGIGLALQQSEDGKSFIGIGIALQHADMGNTAKIKATWPEEWELYRQMAVKMFSDE